MVQEITTTSWGKRIINAFWGVLFGIALIIGAIFLVFWNEGHGLHTAQSLEQAQKILISIPSSPIDNQNNLRVVYLSGLATTEDILDDKLLTISENAIQLNRKVEMYQWKEETETKTEKNLGGSEQEVKTYNYKQIWSQELIDSSNFKDQTGHQNPAEMPVKTYVQYAKNVTVGDFKLPSDLITQITGDKTIDLSHVDLSALQTKLGKPVSADGDILFVGDNSSMPKIGDMRISMTEVLPDTVSIIAQQTGKTLQPFMAKSGKSVSLIEMGQVSPQEMIHNALSENSMITWILRLVSLVLLIIGFALIMNPIVILADVVPFFGSLVGFGTGLVAFIAGIVVWSIAIAIAWFFVRPLLAAGLIIVIAIICYALISYRKKSNLQK
jgi:hypothetical protein